VTTVRTQGFTAIYRGLSALVIGTAAKAGVRFFAFDQFRDMLKDSEGKISAGRSVLGRNILNHLRISCSGVDTRFVY
jgi:solute carrier family 25 citrate transporter 1